MKSIKLPNKPSSLLTLALKDLEKAERSRRYQVNMNNWHVPDVRDGKCFVCLAGAVMAYSLGVGKNVLETPGTLYRENSDGDMYKKLYAINRFRFGSVIVGCSSLDIDQPDLEDIPVTEYGIDKNRFKLDMKNIIKYLKSKKL